MEVVLLFGFAFVVLAVGVRLGMLLAPRVERMADRAVRADLASEPAAEPHHEDDDDRTD